MKFPFHLNKKHPSASSHCFCVFRTFITITSQTLPHSTSSVLAGWLSSHHVLHLKAKPPEILFPALCLHPLLWSVSWTSPCISDPGVPIHVLETQQRPFDFPPRLDVLRSPSSHYWRRMEESKKHKKLRNRKKGDLFASLCSVLAVQPSTEVTWGNVT